MSELTSSLNLKVSICIPVYNTVEYLEECLNSVVQQTYSNFEVIIFDNYSDDGSWELLQAFGQQDDRIVLAQAEKKGMYANWNNTLHRAEGDLIYILTSDDTMYPSCLEVFVESAKKHPSIDLFMSAIDCIDPASEIIPNAWRRFPGVGLYRQWLDREHIRNGQSEYQRMLHIGTTIISVTGMCFRRQLFEKVGGFPVEYASRGDFIWELKAVQETDIFYTPNALATWRQHPEQATQSTGAFAGWLKQQGEDMLAEFGSDAEVQAAADWRDQQMRAWIQKPKEEGIGQFFQRVQQRLLRLIQPYRPVGFTAELILQVQKKIGLADVSTVN